MATIERAIAIAADAHEGQVDKAGDAYIMHVLRVVCSVSTPEERMAAALHDVLEDCPEYSLDRLSTMGIPQEVLDAVVVLTKKPNEPYESFIERVAKNPIARRVKLADLRDNANLSRIASPSPKDHERQRKYLKAIERLTGEAVS